MAAVAADGGGGLVRDQLTVGGGGAGTPRKESRTASGPSPGSSTALPLIVLPTTGRLYVTMPPPTADRSLSTALSGSSALSTLIDSPIASINRPLANGSALIFSSAAWIERLTKSRWRFVRPRSDVGSSCHSPSMSSS